MLMRAEPEKAFFGVGKDIVKPLVKAGFVHKETWKYTGGAKITNFGKTAIWKQQ